MNPKQAETDAAHDLQMARIRELRGNCADWRPPVGVKDVAELNGREQERVRAGRPDLMGCESQNRLMW